MSPYEWLIRERVALASEILESGSSALAAVASHCGFRNEQSLRGHFRQITGTSPGIYRQQFSRQS
jgi:AraC family transcriptional activator FtrA